MLSLTSQANIARQLGVSHKTVKKWKKYYGIEDVKSAPFKRPSKASLRYHLKRKTQKEIAAYFGVSENCVRLWKKHYNMLHVPSLHTTPPDKRPNPIVECRCGCGQTFLKYKFGRRKCGRVWRYERKYVNGHGTSWNHERHLIKVAERWAKRKGDHSANLGSSGVPTVFEDDFSDEYLGEAWLALAEGDDPKRRVDEAKTLDDALKHRTIDIDTVMRHPDIVEQVCYEDPELENEE